MGQGGLGVGRIWVDGNRGLFICIFFLSAILHDSPISWSNLSGINLKHLKIIELKPLVLNTILVSLSQLAWWPCCTKTGTERMRGRWHCWFMRTGLVFCFLSANHLLGRLPRSDRLFVRSSGSGWSHEQRYKKSRFESQLPPGDHLWRIKTRLKLSEDWFSHQ